MERNPFEYGRELNRDELVDRGRELEEIAATIRNRGKLFLIGPRRFGKTSLLHVAAVEAERGGAIVLRFDAEKYETLSLLAQALVTAAARSLRTPLERTLKLLTEVAASLRPQLTLDAQGNLSVGLDAGTRGELPLLTDALDVVEELASRVDRPVVVILDEVQQIVIEHGVTAERQLRATVQRHRHVSYIFAGSAVRLLSAMTSDPGRPFYRLGSRLFLDAVPREDFVTFLEESFIAGGFVVERAGIESILALCDDVPYNVQRLAHELWEMLRAGEVAVVAPAHARAAVDRIVRKEDPAYTQIWTQLSRNQKKALKAVIESGGEQLQSHDVSNRYDVSASSMQTAVASLESAQLIRRVDVRGRAQYRLVDPFLREWLELAQSA